MKITWYGHAAFRIDSNGTTVIMDPCAWNCGYDSITDAADFVTISHDNEKYHSCTAPIQGQPTIVDGMQLAGSSVTHGDITFAAELVYEDADDNGPNAMVTVEMEGLKIAHLGDLGHPLNDRQRDFIADCDILLALAGDAPTISVEDLAALVDDIKPAITIPMHYKTPKIDLAIRPVDDFLALVDADSVRHVGSSTIEVTAETLPGSPQIVVLDYSH
jgi:L-ascorbate metabolism protein UlaG (beta-lactamase superfamily)